jgi:predicted short-subunit dehydrogenase-like oxidoreductase (DUF2520 family)
MKIGFIGAGTVGTALAIRLSSRGYRVTAVASRTLASAERLAQAVKSCRAFPDAQAVADAADLVFITTPDGAIPQVAAQVRWHRGQSVAHCSGADSTDTLQPAKDLGAQTGGFHPLQTFAGVKQAVDNLPGSTFAIEAEEPLLATLKELAEALDGHWIELKASDKVVYHAAAVLACNYLVTLVKLATDLWKTFDVDTPEATRALIPLLKGTLNNVENIGIPNCLTGPIARGDTGTIQKHLKALEAAAPSIVSTYRELGLQTIPVALAKGKIDKARAEELQAVLRQPAAVTGKGR